VLGLFFAAGIEIALGRIIVEQNSFVVGGNSVQPFNQLPAAGLAGG
jgi:hypothetical protein